MSNKSPEEAITFAREIVDKAISSGADQAQALISSNELMEVGFGTRKLSMFRTTDDQDTVLTVFKSGRKGTSTFNGSTTETIMQMIDGR
jgi:PmbA protein